MRRSSARKIELLGVPMDLGQGRRGVDMGPSALRYARIDDALEKLGYEFADHGNVEVSIAEEATDGGRMPHLEAIRKVCERTAAAAHELTEGGGFPLFLGGDHSISIGTVSGVARRARTGVLWVDAHADFNTPGTSPSGNVHGMPLAVLTGKGHPDLLAIGGDGPSVNPHDVVLLGLRSVDPGEKRLLSKAGVHAFTMADIDVLGISQAVERALAKLSHLDAVHLSVDLDAVDPTFASGVGTPVRGGLTYREAHLIMERVGEAGIVTSMDLVEINPILDDRNRTAELAVELLASVMGRRILSTPS